MPIISPSTLRLFFTYHFNHIKREYNSIYTILYPIVVQIVNFHFAVSTATIEITQKMNAAFSKTII